MVLALRIIMAIWIIAFTIILYRDIYKHKNEPESKCSVGVGILYGIMGFVLNLLDTLGVGSNATQMAFFKFTKLSPDDHLPGNGNVIFAIPVAVEFFLFLDIVEVGYVTLIGMIVAAVLGAFVGARFITHLPINSVRRVLSITLPCVAVVLVCKTFGIGPFGMMGSATALTGWRLIVGILINFILGALMTAGVGLYAPCMALCALLGLNITVAFPIMMGSCAMLMPVGNLEFIKQGKYNRPAAAIASITGIIGVFAAYYLVKSMPTTVLTVIVACVLIYMSIMFIRNIRADEAKNKA